MRSGDLKLMARLMIHSTHAVIDNIAASEPELLDAPELADELVLMMQRYVEKSVEPG